MSTQEIEAKLRPAIELAAKTAATKAQANINCSADWHAAYRANESAQAAVRQLLFNWLKAYAKEREGFEANVAITSEYEGVTHRGLGLGTFCFWKGTELAPNAWADKIKIKFPYRYIRDWSDPLLGSSATVRATTRPAYTHVVEIQQDVCAMIKRVASSVVLFEV